MTRRLPRWTVYLLLGEDGRVYCGFTSRLRRRLRQHNDPFNRGWTRGRRQRLLACAHFLDRDSALICERRIKHWRWTKRSWIRRSRRRLRVLCERHGIDHPLAR